MTIAALATERLTLVSLLGDDRSALPPWLQSAAFRDVRHIPVRVEGAAGRLLTASRIDTAINDADRAVLLVAQGAGCLAAAWWARLSPRAYVERVAGAMLVAPAGNRAVSAEFASPRAELPFPSIVIGADDASQSLASEWGSRLLHGPLEPRLPSGRFQSMIARFTRAIVENDVRTAERLIDTIGDR